MRTLLKIAAAISISVFLVNTALADDWYVRRQTTNGACHVQMRRSGLHWGMTLPNAKAERRRAQKPKIFMTIPLRPKEMF